MKIQLKRVETHLNSKSQCLLIEVHLGQRRSFWIIIGYLIVRVIARDLHKYIIEYFTR